MTAGSLGPAAPKCQWDRNEISVHHEISVARSREITGPYERDPQPFVYLDPAAAKAFAGVKSASNPTGEDFENVYATQKKASAEYGGP